jgi:hypothetical protein
MNVMPPLHSGRNFLDIDDDSGQNILTGRMPVYARWPELKMLKAGAGHAFCRARIPE